MWSRFGIFLCVSKNITYSVRIFFWGGGKWIWFLDQIKDGCLFSLTFTVYYVFYLSVFFCIILFISYTLCPSCLNCFRLALKTRQSINTFLGISEVVHPNLAARRWSNAEEDVPQGRPTKKCQVFIAFCFLCTGGWNAESLNIVQCLNYYRAFLT